MKRFLQKGDRIRLKVRLLGGWIGTGKVILHQCSGDVLFTKDGYDDGICIAGREEMVKVRRAHY